MKKTTLFLFAAVLFSSLAAAQTPKGNRVLSWQLDVAEDNNFFAAYATANDACMASTHISYSWSDLEPQPGQFDTALMSEAMDPADIFYTAFGTTAELQLATVNTLFRVVPPDLVAVPWDAPLMINRFKILLDTVFAHLPHLQLDALNIGNESDAYFGTDASQYAAYKNFLDAVFPYAKQKYFELHGSPLKVGTTFTYEGLTKFITAPLCQMVNGSTDVISVTYYPLNPNFTVKAPGVVSGDFGKLVALYPDTTKPIFFVECGYPSSPVCLSSETLQAAFFQNVFDAWDTYYDHVKYLSIFKLTDWSQETVDWLGTYYGSNDPVFLEFLRTLGVRTYPGSGAAKLAYETILCELNARDWCAVNCSLSAAKESSPGGPALVAAPNPASSQVTISGEASLAEWLLFDAAGRQVQHDENSRQIDLTGLPSGLYFLKMKTSDGRLFVDKFVKK
ncbi:MAG: T9SS type A sorting domain-containing protein [Saprospiraceae bacterium]|nr:MAG: T9SS type A sorting domain-containing protein [Saprospiraceae bacterium]